jgi:hypothetical protein
MTVVGPAEIGNYEISKNNAAELVREMSYSASADVKLHDTVKIVGIDFSSGAKLCTDPTGCAGRARHACRGFLSQVGPGEEIHLVFCRGERLFVSEAAEDKQARSQELLTRKRQEWERMKALPWDKQKELWLNFLPNERVEMLTANRGVEDFLACLSIESFAQGSALAAYRAFLASRLGRGDYVAKLDSPPENPVKLLALEGKKQAELFKRETQDWASEAQGADSSSGAGVGGMWSVLTVPEQVQLLAIDTYVEMKGNALVGPVRKWLTDWYTVKANQEDFGFPEIARPAAEWFAGLDRHNALALSALLDAGTDGAESVEYVQYEDVVLLLGGDPSWFLMEAWIRAQDPHRREPGEEEAIFKASKEALTHKAVFHVEQVPDSDLTAAVTRWVTKELKGLLRWEGL